MKLGQEPTGFKAPARYHNRNRPLSSWRGTGTRKIGSARNIWFTTPKRNMYESKEASKTRAMNLLLPKDVALKKRGRRGSGFESGKPNSLQFLRVGSIVVIVAVVDKRARCVETYR